MVKTLDADRPHHQSHHQQNHHECIVYYTNRDLILYAMGIGCDPNEVNELQYLYEHHENFSAFPLFPLALSFRAIARDNNKGSNGSMGGGGDGSSSLSLLLGKYFGMPPFPPPSMSIPALDHFLLASSSQSSNSMLVHLGQKLWIHGGGEPFPTTYLDSKKSKNHHRNHHQQHPIMSASIPILSSTKVISIQPKRKGLLVITETEFSIPTSIVRHDVATTTEDRIHQSRSTSQRRGRVLATSQSITLYILPPKVTSSVQPFPNPASVATLNSKNSDHPKDCSYSSSLSSSPPQNQKDLVRSIIQNQAPNTIQSHDIPSNQAFLYRLSGDSNPLHVVTSTSTSTSTSMPNVNVNENKKSSLFGGQPILHGLCTLGYAIRSVLRYCNGTNGGGPSVRPLSENSAMYMQDGRGLGNEVLVKNPPKSHTKDFKPKLGLFDWDLTFVDCQFVKPLFVGESIHVHIWDFDCKKGHYEDHGGTGTGTSSTSTSTSTINTFADAKPLDATSKWIAFQVRKQSDGTIILDNGFALMTKTARPTVQCKL